MRLALLRNARRACTHLPEKRKRKLVFEVSVHFAVPSDRRRQAVPEVLLRPTDRRIQLLVHREPGGTLRSENPSRWNDCESFWWQAVRLVVRILPPRIGLQFEPQGSRAEEEPSSERRRLQPVDSPEGSSRTIAQLLDSRRSVDRLQQPLRESLPLRCDYR